MAYDGKLLRRAIARLEAQKARREEAREKLQGEIYRKIPRIQEIDRTLRRTIPEVIAAALREGEDPVPAMEALRDRNLSLQEERALLLSQNGYSVYALDGAPACKACGDTGFRGAAVCDCLKKLYAQEQIKELSSLLNLGEQSFDAFRLDYYDTKVWPGKGISPRENMELVYEICLGYARKFGRYFFNNLFLSGGTGLGKTFLSACIAREVSERGFSVVYDTAVSVFSRFEAQKFAKDSEDTRDAKDDTRRYLRCDLLILDDLGSELTTPFVQSALYTLVNARLAAGRQTVINSNLSMEDVRRRYFPQTASRLEGEYRTLPFFGEDIRLLRGKGTL
ncbi:MAG: ATP-binding protein [Oscillospiraceae bacterium]|nr:ATP-binding protein [Oscillospiraceae bacterium]